ncbi:MAG TPA: glycosyltransferase [Chitinophagaceae bacterium]|nr:glycosyltransferase [Chitinophagaceae bacterium]
MQKLFPSLEFVSPPRYSMKYGKTRWGTIAGIIAQIPKILTAINREKIWLKEFAKEKHLDVVFSDNRYGLYHPEINCVFITHQLLIKTPFGKWADAWLQQINYRFINRFNYCWVPDAASMPYLAGELSHPKHLPAIPTHYVGAQSSITIPAPEAVTVKPYLLVLLSGPEPQRSLLENLLLQQLETSPMPVEFVRGLPAEGKLPVAPPNVSIHQFLGGRELEEMINEAAIVLSRAGYSSIMDLLPIGKRCIFIPTPGQAEQEYLATWVLHNRYAHVVQQDKFLLRDALAKAALLEVPDLSSTKNDQLMLHAITALQQVIYQKQNLMKDIAV